MTKEMQTQPNVSALPQTMPESPIQSFVIQPANPKRCIQSLEPIQSPNPTKKAPLPKLKIRRSENGLISELSEDPQRKSRENDVIPISDVIDLCDDDWIEIVSIKPAPRKKNSS